MRGIYRLRLCLWELQNNKIWRWHNGRGQEQTSKVIWYRQWRICRVYFVRCSCNQTLYCFERGTFSNCLTIVVSEVPALWFRFISVHIFMNNWFLINCFTYFLCVSEPPPNTLVIGTSFELLNEIILELPIITYRALWHMDVLIAQCTHSETLQHRAMVPSYYQRVYDTSWIFCAPNTEPH